MHLLMQMMFVSSSSCTVPPSYKLICKNLTKTSEGFYTCYHAIVMSKVPNLMVTTPWNARHLCYCQHASW